MAAVHVYVKNAADVAGMTEVWRTYWPKDAPARTTIIADLVQPGALVEMSMVAVPTGGERVVVAPAGWSTANPYSYAIRSGDTLFLSGIGLARHQGQRADRRRHDDADERTVMANAGELLKAAGFAMSDVVAIARVHHRRREVPGDEQGLRADVPEGSARARHGDRRPARARRTRWRSR